MKTLTFTGVWLLIGLTNVSAATLNLGSDCDTCVKYISCVAREVESDIRAQLADCSTPGGLVENFETAGDKCLALFPGHELDLPHFAETAFRYAANYIFDETCAGFDADAIAESGRAIAYNLITECVNYGYCYCDTGYFIQPRGLTPMEWGKNSECRQCPTGGTTAAPNKMLLDSCFIPAGSEFSDESGSGVFVDQCHSGYGSQEEYNAAWQ